MRRRSNHGQDQDSFLLELVRAIFRNDASRVTKLLKQSPDLAREHLTVGASRDVEADFYFKEIDHYLYAGDTALHAAAFAYRTDIARILLQHGADLVAKNRRGAEPLHYAADGGPGLKSWDPKAQAEMIAFLIKAGANANALDQSGVAPIHRAVRQRCSSALNALLDNGAQVRLKNKSGSTPLHLAVQNTGRGGSGSPEAKSHQEEIIQTLLKRGGTPSDRDNKGKTVAECIQGNWIRKSFPGLITNVTGK